MNSERRTRLSTAFLLLVILTGWIVAPLVHEIGHALERAELTHVHDVQDNVTLRTGCEPLPSLADECPINLTHLPAVGLVPPSVEQPAASTTTWTLPRDIVSQRTSLLRFVRGPPDLI